jgi:hypothetical protein
MTLEEEIRQEFITASEAASEQPIDGWLRDNVSLDNTSPIQGPYRISNSPQLREPLLAFQDESIRMVTTVGPNQGGRTKAMEGASMWAVVNRPGPMQWNTAKDESAKEFAEQRWWPAAKSCNAVMAKVKHERIRSALFTDGMPFKIQGCAETNLEEKSIMTQFNDECSQWAVGRLKIAHKRCNIAYAWNYKAWNGSWAGVDGDDFHLLFRSGSQEDWHWKCPKCGYLQVPKWGNKNERGGIKWADNEVTRPKGREWDFDALRKTVRYQCENCPAEFSDTSKSRRILNEHARYVSLNNSAPSWHRSFRFNILSVNWPGITWAQWVEEYLTAVSQFRRYGNIEPLKIFWTRLMAEWWDESKHIGGNRKTVLSDYNLYDNNGINIYIKGQWEGESIRFLGSDKQEWGYPYVIRACKPTGESRLIDRGVSEDDCLRSYDEIEARAAEFGVAAQCVIIDSAFEPREVYAQAAVRGWTCMRGVDRAELFKHIKEVIDPVSRTLKRISIELPYSAENWCDAFTGTSLQQINRRIGRRAAPRLARRYDWMNLHIKNLLAAFKEGSAIYWGLAADVGAEYIRQLNAETRHMIINARGKRTDWWSNTNAEGTGTKRPNHAWDVECMILVAMCLQRLIDLSDWKPEESIDVDSNQPAFSKN